MLFCKECKHISEEEDLKVYRNDCGYYAGMPAYEEFQYCPCCGSDDLTEYFEFCARCGAATDNNSHLCDSCEEEMAKIAEELLEKYSQAEIDFIRERI